MDFKIVKLKKDEIQIRKSYSKIKIQLQTCKFFAIFTKKIKHQSLARSFFLPQITQITQIKKI